MQFCKVPKYVKVVHVDKCIFKSKEGGGEKN